MLSKMLNMDKRIIYILLALTIIIPTFLQLRMPISVSSQTQASYDYIESLPVGSTVMVSFDFGPSSLPEPEAIAETILAHCFSRGIRVIGLTLDPTATILGSELLEDVASKKGAILGEDYVYLGFRPGALQVILGMGISITNHFESDYYGTPITDIPMMQGITNYNDISVLVTLCSSSIVDAWIIYANSQYGLKIIAGTTAVINTQLTPYVQSGQLVGLLNGYLGAAE